MSDQINHVTAKNIVIVAHKFLTQPDDDYVHYLNDNKYANIMHIRHSFSDAADRCSYYAWYKKGALYKEYRTRDYQNLNEACIYLKEFFFSLKWVLESEIKWDAYIGMDGLCVYWGNLMRSMGRVRKTIFWAIDFVPENRFTNNIKNKIYHWINKRGYTTSDEMWDLSPRMADAREKFLAVTKNSYRVHKIVSYGAWINLIRKYRYDDCEKKSVVFMGHLLEKQGVQLVIKAISEIVKEVPDFRFKIIGGGQYKEDLIALASHLHVLSYCSFLGKIEAHRDLENEIAKSCLAIAPYIKKLDTWTYYADPGKVKTYLACGVPVLLTDIPWNATEIEKNKCGKIIQENSHDIAVQIIRLLADADSCRQMRDNAVAYSQSFNYDNIFSNLYV